MLLIDALFTTAGPIFEETKSTSVQIKIQFRPFLKGIKIIGFL